MGIFVVEFAWSLPIKMDENAYQNFDILSHNFLNNGLISKIQSSAESARLSTSDNPHVSLIRTNTRGQTGADYWKFTVYFVL